MFRTVTQAAPPALLHGALVSNEADYLHPGMELQGITWSKEKRPTAAWHTVLVTRHF